MIITMIIIISLLVSLIVFVFLTGNMLAKNQVTLASNQKTILEQLEEIKTRQQTITDKNKAAIDYKLDRIFDEIKNNLKT